MLFSLCSAFLVKPFDGLGFFHYGEHLYFVINHIVIHAYLVNPGPVLGVCSIALSLLMWLLLTRFGW